MSAAAASRRILVVDDDEAIRQSVTEALEEEGYLVRSARDGVEALAEMRSPEPPGLVLLDLWMPVMDGWQVLHEKGLDPRIVDIPVCVITAAPAIVSQLPVKVCLRKPLDVQRLLDVVQQHC